MKDTIVHIHQKFYPYMGGSTHRLLEQLIRLKDYNIYVICQMHSSKKKFEKYKNIKILRYDSFFEIPALIKKINQKSKIKIIHSHNYRPSLFSYLSSVFLKVPFIMEMHSIYNVNNGIKRRLGRFILKKSDLRIVLSNESKNIIKNDFLISGDTEIIYNGIDFNYFVNNKQYDLSFDEGLSKFVRNSRRENKKIIGYVGSIRDFQGIDNIIRIINCVTNNNVNFLIIGGSKNEIAKVNKRIVNKNVFLREFVGRQNVKSIYLSLDILLMPRPNMLSTKSAIPLKPIEAIALGRVVMATPVDAMLELKSIIKSNLLFCWSLEEMILTMSNDKLLNDMCNTEESKQLNLSPFDINSQVGKLISIYRHLS
jgi:glycosyltransferase involved in cell wall biosynthesis